MRNLPNESAPDSLNPADRGGRKAAPQRRCVLSGESEDQTALIRLAISPDGLVLPDIAGKAPGRGAWIKPDRNLLEKAGAKGLRGALARSFKGGDFTVSDDLADLIAAQLAAATLNRLGLESRASNLLTGTEKIAAAARSGEVSLLLHASDSAEDGRSRLAQAWRVGMDREGSGDKGMVLPVGRDSLSIALGRQNAVHVAILGQKAAERVNHNLERWLNYISWPMDAATQAGASVAEG